MKENWPANILDLQNSPFELISSLEDYLKFTSLDPLGPTQVKYVNF